MKRYHVNFKSNAESFYSTGENFEAPSALIALGMFIVKHPEAMFLAMYCVEDIASLLPAHKLVYEENKEAGFKPFINPIN